jgi:hypothetical protein
MTSSRTRERLDSWSSRTKPIHKIFSDRINSHSVSGILFRGPLLEFLLLEHSIPKKALPISSLYKVRKITIPPVRPQLASRIGVGYKDKGSLPSGEYDPPEVEVPLLSENFFDFSELNSAWNDILKEFPSKYNSTK